MVEFMVQIYGICGPDVTITEIDFFNVSYYDVVESWNPDGRVCQDALPKSRIEDGSTRNQVK